MPIDATFTAWLNTNAAANRAPRTHGASDPRTARVAKSIAGRTRRVSTNNAVALKAKSKTQRDNSHAASNGTKVAITPTRNFHGARLVPVARLVANSWNSR